MKFKDLFFPKNKRFEFLLRHYALYTPDEHAIKLAPTQRLFDLKKLKFISNGLQARVFKLRGLDWVVKEGRWDLDLNLFGPAKLPLPAELTERILNLFSFTFLPDKKEILRQYKAYLKFIQYFGYFQSEDDYYHPNLELITNAQKNIRDSLSFYKDDLEAFYKIKFHPNIDKVINSEVKYHNFLPKEYLLIGKAVSAENKGRNTYYIIQEFVKGDLLHDMNVGQFSNEIKKQMALMVYLMLLMRYQINLVPDTRPRYPFLQINNWLTKTDNVILTKDQVKFIDTRWFWDYKSNFIKRGAIIPDMIINLSKSYINVLLNELE
jgi:hypothetical protein